ncbi:MAG: transglycosylase domain-containing protein [Hyphomicrobiaceae bacterium]
MLTVFRLCALLIETMLSLPVRLVHFLANALFFNPSLGRFRYVVAAVAGYVVFAVLLVYVFAPLRGFSGQYWLAEKLRYDSERWLATAIYDADGSFVGTFDPLLDSKRDLNTTDRPIELADTGYVANPDHKSIPVEEAPDYYWRCLVYHEDRNIGSWLNPYGIDLVGVLKIPYSTIARSLSGRGFHIGVGGSTLPMQLARVIYKTPPSQNESVATKLGRKFSEWWDAPVIYWALTKDGDIEPLKQWASNHLWLAQRTGGSPLHGVEMTSRIVFGKPAKELTVAEQLVLASAVNKPIILMPGSERLNAVRLDRWRYIVDVRARKCASELLPEPEQKAVWFELTQIANGPPDPQVKPKLQEALDELNPEKSKAAQANPVLRANLLLPAGLIGAREEMKNEFGYGWREYVRGVTLSFDALENRRFRETVKARLATLQTQYQAQIDPGFTLDLSNSGAAEGKTIPNIVIAAANAKGEIVRYFEGQDIAAYYGSAGAIDRKSGHYEPARESRAIASVGKMIAAIAIASHGRDTVQSLYSDPEAPSSGLETCRHDGHVTRGRKAIVAFACSLNKPIEWRAAQIGQAKFRRLIDGFGFAMPPPDADGQGTPPSTAAVRGLIAGSPRRVHHMASIVLAALTGRGGLAVKQPSLIKTFAFDRALLSSPIVNDAGSAYDVIPDSLIDQKAHGLVKSFLSAPLCYEAGKQRIGTLRSISDWCAARRNDVKLHFAKTGTQVTLDPDATVDTWVAGGIQFTNGAAYSYVIVVGTGNANKPWARKLHAAQVAAPLAEILLEDLAREAKKGPVMATAD